MNYQETLTYLYTSAPLFQHVGKDAYKEGLDTTHKLDSYFGHPHRNFRTIHIAGTNGKGSCSHTLSAILQSAGYRVGLYTSPHLVDFRERIRVNGVCVPKEYVVGFVEKYRSFFEPLHPSFFELTTAMAFRYFADEKVDVAVVEVGLGGRLDCTNIISPDLSIITNISFDHMQFLGDTLAKIACEKAGIIKNETLVVIGESTCETRDVFLRKAEETHAPISFAEEERLLEKAVLDVDGFYRYQTSDYGEVIGELGGIYQEKNTNTLLSALRHLRQMGYHLSEKDVKEGFAHVCRLSGLMGRWQTLSVYPKVVCDTGHNVGGIQYVVNQLLLQKYRRLHIVIGMVNDKDIDGVLSLFPLDAIYYFTQASVQRALPSAILKEHASVYGLQGDSYSSVKIAFEAARSDAAADDFIFVGGSSFVVADILKDVYCKEESDEREK